MYLILCQVPVELVEVLYYIVQMYLIFHLILYQNALFSEGKIVITWFLHFFKEKRAVTLQ